MISVIDYLKKTGTRGLLVSDATEIKKTMLALCNNGATSIDISFEGTTHLVSAFLSSFICPVLEQYPNLIINYHHIPEPVDVILHKIKDSERLGRDKEYRAFYNKLLEDLFDEI